MERYSHISFKDLFIYFIATMLFIVSLSHASNPLTSDGFDDVLALNAINKTYQFAYNQKQIVQVQIINDLVEPSAHLLNLKSLYCDEQLWDIVNKAIIKNKTYNSNMLADCIYNRTFAHKKTMISINLRFLIRDKNLDHMQSVEDFDSEDQFTSNFLNYVTNEIYGDFKVMDIHNKKQAQTLVDAKEKISLASMYR